MLGWRFDRRLTKRLESALRLFDENYRIYQYLFKRNNPEYFLSSFTQHQWSMRQSSIVSAYLRVKAGKLFSLSIYYIVLFRGLRYRTIDRQRTGRNSRESPGSLGELRAWFSTKNRSASRARIGRAESTLLQKSRSFILQVSDFLRAHAGQTG